MASEIAVNLDLIFSSPGSSMVKYIDRLSSVCCQLG
jgi:hypothetical protein